VSPVIATTRHSTVLKAVRRQQALSRDTIGRQTVPGNTCDRRHTPQTVGDAERKPVAWLSGKPGAARIIYLLPAARGKVWKRSMMNTLPAIHGVLVNGRPS
jgi:hypothetical protein